jgi:hypothetical protein
MRYAWPFLIPIVGILAGCAIAISRTMARARVRELEIRERIAMIERGLVPPPEVDPGGFDRAMSRYEGRRSYYREDRSPQFASRHRRVAIVLMGIGIGLMLLIGLEESAERGVGVGGFVVVLGLAFLISSYVQSPRSHLEPRPVAPPPPIVPGPSGHSSPPAPPTSPQSPQS